MRRIGAALACVLLLPAAMGQGSAESVAAAEQETVARLQGWAKSLLAVPANLQIDASLRESVNALADEHLSRVESVFRQWFAEELALVDPARMPELDQRMVVRYMNELSLWRLESPGAEYDEVMLELIMKPGICRLVDGVNNDFARHVLMLQALMPSKRKAALAGERELLARWGRSRMAVPPRPVPSQRELEEQTITQLKAGQGVADRPMLPVLAARVLDNTKQPLTSGVTCALRQWGLDQALAKSGARRNQALTAYRYATMPLAAEWLEGFMPSGAEKSSRAPDRYPSFASYYGVQGIVTLNVTTDVEGRFKSAVVVDRVISVPGVRGMRPVAFETALDEASIARAAVLTYPKRDVSQANKGLVTSRMEVQWKLE